MQTSTKVQTDLGGKSRKGGLASIFLPVQASSGFKGTQGAAAIYFKGTQGVQLLFIRDWMVKLFSSPPLPKDADSGIHARPPVESLHCYH